LPTDRPNLPRELAALGGRRFVNYLSARVVFSSGVAFRCGYIIAQRLCSGVVLASPSSLAVPRHRQSQARVAGLAEPAEIFRGVVPLVAIPVIDYQESSGAA
jgi:hypothetical protein